MQIGAFVKLKGFKKALNKKLSESFSPVLQPHKY